MWDFAEKAALLLGSFSTLFIVFEVSGLSLIAFLEWAFRVEQGSRPKYLLAKLVVCGVFITVACLQRGWRFPAYIVISGIILGIVPPLVTLVRAKMGS